MTLINHTTVTNAICLVYTVYWLALLRKPADWWFYIDLQAPRNIKLYCVLAHKVLQLAGPAGFLPVGSFVFISLILWKSNITTESLGSDLVGLMVPCTTSWTQLLHRVTSGQPIAEQLEWVVGEAYMIISHNSWWLQTGGKQAEMSTWIEIWTFKEK